MANGKSYGKSDKPNLNAHAWAVAALNAIAQRGIDGVAVEPLARKLGVTKGSFYWHFANREALLQHALKLWEQEETDEVLARVEAESRTPRERIERIVAEVNASKRASRIYQALSSASDDPLIADFVHRVSERRLHFLIDAYAALGLSQDDARQWALMTYSVFLGTLQIRRDIPEEWPSADEPAFKDYVSFLIQTLIPHPPTAAEAATSNPDYRAANAATQ